MYDQPNLWFKVNYYIFDFEMIVYVYMSFSRVLIYL